MNRFVEPGTLAVSTSTPSILAISGADVIVIIVLLSPGFEEFIHHLLNLILERRAREEISQRAPKAVFDFPGHLPLELHRGGDAVMKNLRVCGAGEIGALIAGQRTVPEDFRAGDVGGRGEGRDQPDRKSTRLNSSHQIISYAVFCLKKKTKRSAPCTPTML